MSIEQTSSIVEDGTPEKLFKEKVSGISGIPIDKLVRRDETNFIGDSEEGSVDVILTSVSNLEEDISMMDLERTVFSKDEQREILNNVSYELIKKIGDYVPDNILKRLFPGLELPDVDSYDFSRSKIKLFILSPNDYKMVFSEMYPNERTDTSGGRAYFPDTVRRSTNVSKEIGVDLSENKLIIINERMPRTQWIFNNKKIDQAAIENIDGKKKEMLRDHIKRVAAHELIHLVDVATDLPTPLTEAITEWYAQQVVNHWYGENESFTSEHIPVGYSSITPGISILFNAALESGIDGSVIDKAFISNDVESRQNIYNYLYFRYGEESADKIWNWSFKRNENPLKYIIDLESKQNSKTGEFLKKYGTRIY